MLPLKNKEPLTVKHGITLHKPEINEACIVGGIIIVICLALNFRFPSPVVWSLIAIVSTACAVFDVIPPEKPLRTLLIGVILGASLAFIATF